MGMMSPNAYFSHTEAFCTHFRTNLPLQQSESVFFGWNLCEPQREGNTTKHTTWSPFKPSIPISASIMKTHCDLENFSKIFSNTCLEIYSKIHLKSFVMWPWWKTKGMGKTQNSWQFSNSLFFRETSLKPHKTCPQSKTSLRVGWLGFFFSPSFAF